MMLAIPLGPTSDAWRGPVFLASGHRPFFLATAVWAAVALPLWLLAWRGLLPLSSSWHGHELVFGFAVAAIAGFLQAAVPKWTGQPLYRGDRVAWLAALWLLGRLAMAADLWLPGAARLDLLFLPLLAFFIGRDIVRAKNTRNYPVVGVLLGLWGLDALWQFGQPALALRAAVYLVVALIALIAGRIVPSFTQNALRQAGRPEATCKTPKALDVLAVPSMLAVVVTELLAPLSPASGVAALVAGVLLGTRMAGWLSWQTRALPLVWILHVGYAFLPLGLVLKAISDFGGPVGVFAALHALTAGAIGVMILAVASRAALGHSGRPLQPSRATVAAYYLVISGALLRTFGWHPHATLTAGVLWALGYAVFAVVYFPILTRPRIDGQPG